MKKISKNFLNSFYNKIKFDFYGTIFGVVGALLVASNLGFIFYGFLLYWISSLLYIIYSAQTKQKNLLVLNIIFLIINTIGIIRY